MHEHPVIFSGPMILAILEGRKTQTRRMLKPQPTFGRAEEWRQAGDFWFPVEAGHAIEDGRRCPYDGPGTPLWVRETWSHDAPDLEACRRAYEDALPGISFGPYYQATEIATDTLRWRPSIHMPRWASRITLEVTGVRVERVAEISVVEFTVERVP